MSCLTVMVTTSHRLLGGVIGDQSGSVDHVNGCVSGWITTITKLAHIAETQPQLSYSAYTRSIQSQWSYLQRVVPECGHLFESVDKIVTERLLPTFFGCEICPLERNLFSLPIRSGGLNILKPVDTADSNYHTSRKLTSYITSALKGNVRFDMTEFDDHYTTVTTEITQSKNSETQRMFDDIVPELHETQKRAVQRARETKISLWLNVTPVAKHHFDLSAQEFRDSLAIRYKKPL